MDKLSIEDVVGIVEREGLGYAILHYMNAKTIENQELRKLWTKARAILEQIEKILEDEIEKLENEEERVS